MGKRANSYCVKCHLRREDHSYADERHPYVGEFDTSSVDTVFCPWCGYDCDAADVNESCQLDCPECDREFSVEVDYTVSYSTNKLECFACRGIAEKALRVKLGGDKVACSEACQSACNEAYATYIKERTGYPQRGFLKERGSQ